LIFKKSELKYLWPFYLSSFIFGLFAMIGPFLVLYFKKTGLSYFKIELILAVFGYSMVIFQLPTGAMADGVSRKYSVVIGFFISAISAGFMPFMKDYYLLLTTWIFLGIGVTFISGAQTAWVVDNLAENKRDDLVQEYFIKESSMTALGATVAPLIGSWIVKDYSIDVLWYFFGIGSLINAFLLLIFAREFYTPQKVKLPKLFGEIYSKSKTGLKFVVSQKNVLFIIMAELFVALMLFGATGEQPFLVQLGMADFQLGYMYSAIAIASVVAPFFAKYFVNFNQKNVLLFAISGRMVLFLSLLVFRPPFFFMATVLIVFRNGLYRFTGPVSESYFQKHISQSSRATVSSIRSMIVQFFMAMSALIAGFLMDKYGPQKILALGGLFGIFAVFFYKRIRD
jgi:MFS family permease